MRYSNLPTVILALVLLSCPDDAQAVEYGHSSVLSMGKWVKIKVTETGVHQLTREQLASFGFSNPDRVAIYGTGGNVANESLRVSFTDDLAQVAQYREDGNIYFYALGPVAKDVTRRNLVEGQIVSVIPKPNPYSTYGVYFLTDSGQEEPLLVADAPDYAGEPSGDHIASGYAVHIEEKELYNPGRTGQNFLGDYLMSSGGACSYSFPVPGFDRDGQLYFNANFAVQTNGYASLDVTLGGGTPEILSTNRMPTNYDIDYEIYSPLLVYGNMDAADATVRGEKINIDMACRSEVQLYRCWVDYVTLTYPASNTLPADSAQASRYVIADPGDEVQFGPLNATTHVWRVADEDATEGIAYPTADCTQRIAPDGTFVNENNAGWAEYVIFDTSRPLPSPRFVETVANQNLHAMSVPDMLILTTADMMAEAERLADYHRRVDGMDVAVVDHNLVFNEFSSGVRDAMAYRRLCNMLYDRDSDKFRYLLLFGGGTYDNRMLEGDAAADRLLTYQSEESASSVRSFSSDDFFAIIDNYATGTLNGRELNIAVGRLPFFSAGEAAAYVDKVIRRMEMPEDATSDWRNNLLVVSEDGDDDVHSDQGETFVRNLRQSGNCDMNITKIYLKAYSDDSSPADKFEEELVGGTNFVTFIGHSNPSSLTKDALLLNMYKEETMRYENFPIMYLSSCNTGYYDSGSSDIVSTMLSDPDGGAVAVIASTRIAYTNLNGRLSDSMARVLSEAAGGGMTVGELLMRAKNTSNETSTNRLKYHVFGDPALPVVVPANRVRLTRLDGVLLADGASVTVRPGEKVSVEGTVLAADSTLDVTFDGRVIITLFDEDVYYTRSKVTTASLRNEVDVYTRGARLGQWNLAVEGGRFVGEFPVPQTARTDDGNFVVRMTAVETDGGNRVVSGSCSTLYADRSSSGDGITSDNERPVIEAFYIDSKDTFSDGAAVGQDITLCAEVRDNVGLATSTEVVGSGINLSLDDGKMSTAVPVYYPTGENGGTIRMPLTGLIAGRHTATLKISDYAGNTAVATLSFFVNPPTLDAVVVVEETALRDRATITVEGTTGSSGEAELCVADDSNNLLFRTVVSSFPYVWDVCGNDGVRLPAGVYNLYAVIGGLSTPVKKIVVLRQ